MKTKHDAFVKWEDQHNYMVTWLSVATIVVMWSGSTFAACPWPLLQRAHAIVVVSVREVVIMTNKKRTAASSGSQEQGSSRQCRCGSTLYLCISSWKKVENLSSSDESDNETSSYTFSTDHGKQKERQLPVVVKSKVLVGSTDVARLHWWALLLQGTCFCNNWVAGKSQSSVPCNN